MNTASSREAIQAATLQAKPGMTEHQIAGAQGAGLALDLDRPWDLTALHRLGCLPDGTAEAVLQGP